MKAFFGSLKQLEYCSCSGQSLSSSRKLIGRGSIIRQSWTREKTLQGRVFSLLFLRLHKRTGNVIIQFCNLATQVFKTFFVQPLLFSYFRTNATLCFRTLKLERVVSLCIVLFWTDYYVFEACALEILKTNCLQTVKSQNKLFDKRNKYKIENKFPFRFVKVNLSTLSPSPPSPKKQWSRLYRELMLALFTCTGTTCASWRTDRQGLAKHTLCLEATIWIWR